MCVHNCSMIFFYSIFFISHLLSSSLLCCWVVRVCCAVICGRVVDVVRGYARVILCMSFSVTFSVDEDCIIYLPRMSHSARYLMMKGAEKKRVIIKIKRIDRGVDDWLMNIGNKNKPCT